MKTSTKMTMASAVVACGFAATAGSASAAYAINPAATPFTGANASPQTFKIGATGPTVTCSSATFTGTTRSPLSPSTSFTAAFSGTGSGGSCPAGVLGNVAITVSGPWDITITGGGPSPAAYTGDVTITPGSTIVIEPLTVPTCTITITSSGNGTLSGLTGTNTTPTGVKLGGTVSGITYTASSGCPGVAAGTRSDAVYNTGANGIDIPGLTLTGP